MVIAGIYPYTYPELQILRIFLGGYDPRLQDNVKTLSSLCRACDTLSLPYTILSSLSGLPTSTSSTEKSLVVFIPNFTTAQRTALLHSPKTSALLYTPTNEHFGIGPVEGMIARLPVLACESGGPMESILPFSLRNDGQEDGTGWLRRPEADEWATALQEITQLSPAQRTALGERAYARAKDNFSMDTMSGALEDVLKSALLLGDVVTADTAKQGLMVIKVGALIAAIGVYLGWL